MKLFKAIEKRRSIRSFKDEPVSEDKIHKILEAAIKAPSAGNMQPWEFYVIEDKEIKNKIVNATFTGYSKSGASQEWLNNAPVLILICADIKRPGARYGMDGIEIYSKLDIAGAMQNILLVATSLGLGSCWVGGFDKEKVKEILDLDKNIIPIGMTPIGHPTHQPPAPNRLSVDEVTHFI